MKIIRFAEARRCEPEADWWRASLCNESDISVEHFVKPPGHSSPQHEHPSAQILVVLDGKLILVDADGDEQELGEGDAAYIPGGEEHIVTNPLESATSGLDIFVPGRSFDFWLDRAKE